MKTRTLFLTILYVLPIFLFAASPTQAAVYTANATDIKADEVIEDDLFITGKTVTIEGTVRGDVYIGAETVTVTGKVEGDLLVAGSMVIIKDALVKDDLRVAGGNVTIENTQVGDNLTILAGSAIASKTKIGGSVSAGTGMLQFEGEVGRNLYAGAGAINLTGMVGKEVKVYTDSLIVGDNSLIKGPLTYYSNQDAVVSQSAKIEGGLKREAQPQAKGPNTNLSSPGTRLYFFFAMLLIGLLLVHFLPRPLNIIEEDLRTHPIASLGWGIVVFILTMPLAFILGLTGVGLPLAGILMMLFMIVLLIAPIIVGLALGRFILTNLGRNSQSLMLELVVGLASYYLLSAIPFISGLIWLMARFMTLGAIFLYMKKVLTFRKPLTDASAPL